MALRYRPHHKLCLALALLALGILEGACRSRTGTDSNAAEPGPAGEPDRYSATIIRTVEAGDLRETSESRVARSGDFRREEWVERGERRALIWRPDLGKSFLLSLDRKVYTEIGSAIARAREPEPPNRNGPQVGDDLDSPKASSAEPVPDPEAIDRAFNGAPLPVSVETRLLPEEAIDEYQCEVFERRASFSDGHTELTRVFRARALAGLAIRVEAESISATRRTRVVTERRDIRTEVDPEEFNLPEGFTRVGR